jgi:cytochrome c
MDDNFNTIAGWVLGAGIAALGFTILSGELFKHEEGEKGGFPVEVVETAPTGVPEIPIATLLQTADPAAGEGLFTKCAACHTITAGGANGQGPNLHGLLGRPIGKQPGFSYSAAVAAKGGNWNFDALNAWLTSPKKFIDGTKMNFAGLSKGTDRANLIAYINTQGSNLPLPAAPKADAAAAPAK